FGSLGSFGRGDVQRGVLAGVAGYSIIVATFLRPWQPRHVCPVGRRHAFTAIRANVFAIRRPESFSLFITCYPVAGQVYVNRRTQHDVRASARPFAICQRRRLLAGHLLVGGVRSLDGQRSVPAFSMAAVLSGTLIEVFALGFHTKAE